MEQTDFTIFHSVHLFLLQKELLVKLVYIVNKGVKLQVVLVNMEVKGLTYHYGGWSFGPKVEPRFFYHML